MGRPKKTEIKDEPTTENVPADTTSYSFVERDENGLIVGVNYHFTEQGFVDWRKMINPEFIVLSKERKDDAEKEYGKSFSELQKIMREDESQIDDKFKLILLAGFKELAQLRGYTSITYPYTVAHPDYVSKTCQIQWVGNFETQGRDTTFEDGADANRNNTFSWYGNYLTTAATNRAFVRAVRNFLGVHVIGSDEIGPNKPQTGNSSNEETYEETAFGYTKTDKLEQLVTQTGWTFEDLKSQCVEKKVAGAESWVGYNDISGRTIYTLIDALEKKLNK